MLLSELAARLEVIRQKILAFKARPGLLPTPPTGLLVLYYDLGNVILDWTDNPEPGITGYRVYLSADRSSFAQQAQVSPSTYSGAIGTSGLKFFRVTALNVNGESLPSNIVQAFDRTSPAAPISLIVTNVTATTITLDWPDSTEADFAYYRVYRSTDNINFTRIASDFTNSVYIATSLTSDTLYYFKVTVSDQHANESGFSNTVSQATPDITAPGVPGNFRVTSVGSASIDLAWNVSTGGDVAGYKIYRSTDGVNFSLYAQPGNVLTFTDSGLTSSTTYYYKGSAFDEVPNESAQTAAVSGTTSGVVVGIPTHIQNAAAGQWTAIGTNTLSSVAYSPPPLPGGLQGIMSAWSGAAYDYARHKLYINGGGHNDYSGNEWYAFNLQTNAWIRVNDPAAVGGDVNGIYPDGTPVPIHTYDSICVTPLDGKIYRLGIGGSLLQGVWSFDPALASGSSPAPWTRRADLPFGDPSGLCSAWMPDEAKFLIVNHTNFSRFNRYDPASNTFSTLQIPMNTDTNGSPINGSLAYSPDYRLGFYHRTSLTANTYGMLNCNTNTGSTQVISGATLPGQASVEYDTTRKVFVVYSDLEADTRPLYSIDPLTWVATQLPAAGGATPTSGSLNNGLFSRFAYCADYDVFLMVNRVNASVYLYKPQNWSLPATATDVTSFTLTMA